MQATAPIIAIDNVTKTFDGGAGRVTALSNVNLAIAPGEFISLIGPSGCGKSTLMRLIGDLTEPTSGTISVKGKTPQRARQDRDYGIVFQAPVLYEWRTVQRNVELPLEVIGMKGEERTRKAQEMFIAARFLRASFKGWEYCRDNVDACVQIVLKNDASGVMTQEAQKWQVEEINKLIWPLPECAESIGYMCPDQFKQTADIANQFGVIKAPATDAAYTHEIWEMTK